MADEREALRERIAEDVAVRLVPYARDLAATCPTARLLAESEETPRG